MYENIFAALASSQDEKAVNLMKLIKQDREPFDIEKPHIPEQRTLLDYAFEYECKSSAALLLDLGAIYWHTHNGLTGKERAKKSGLIELINEHQHRMNSTFSTQLISLGLLSTACKSRNLGRSMEHYPVVPISDVPEKSNVVVMSIPKTGTNLFRKCLDLLTGHTTYAGHLQFMSNIKFLISHPEIPVIIPMRDPRDAFVSLIYHSDLHWDKYWQGPNILSHLNNDIHVVVDNEFRDKWFSLDFKRKLLMSMNIEEPVPVSLFVDYEILEKFVSVRSNTCVIKFEDLIGSKGGGDDLKQERAVKTISDFIGHKVSDEDIGKIRQYLFGDSPTFREGKIGSYKEHFDQEIVDIFEKCLSTIGMQDLLSKYGYETGACLSRKLGTESTETPEPVASPPILTGYKLMADKPQEIDDKHVVHQPTNSLT